MNPFLGFLQCEEERSDAPEERHLVKFMLDIENLKTFPYLFAYVLIAAFVASAAFYFLNNLYKADTTLCA